MIHLVLHVLVPLFVAVVFFRRDWQRAFLLMMLTMLVDLDHLLADPIYDLSLIHVGFHLLHGFLPIACYFLLCFFKPTRYVGLGLCIHMLLDSIDCQVTNGVWFLL